MKHTTPAHLLSRDLLCFIRDHSPTTEEFIAGYGGPGGQVFHILRKAGVVVVEDERVRLGRRYLSPDGSQFVWGGLVIFLDRDEVRHVRWGPQGLPVFATDN